VDAALCSAEEITVQPSLGTTSETGLGSCKRQQAARCKVLPLFLPPRPPSWQPQTRIRGRAALSFVSFLCLSLSFGPFSSFVISLVHTSSSWDRPGRRTKGSLQRASYRTQTRENLSKFCPHWKGRQKILWAAARRGEGRGKERFKNRDLFADERCSQPILDFLSTINVGRLVPTPAEEDIQSGVSGWGLWSGGSGKRRGGGGGGWRGGWGRGVRTARIMGK